MEWKLWEGDEPPFFTQPEFFAAHPRIAGCHQIGYYERQQLVATAIAEVYRERPFVSMSDLGCGDGTLLNDVYPKLPFVKMWGYDLGQQNTTHARDVYGLDVRQGDFVNDPVELGECVLLTEVLEHMVNPHDFIKKINTKIIIATSPVAETDEWHYEHHAWAWDLEGFAAMFINAGWTPFYAMTCVAKGLAQFGPSGVSRRPSFQCIAVRRSE
jgi:hypothetical protein